MLDIIIEAEIEQAAASLMWNNRLPDGVTLPAEYMRYAEARAAQLRKEHQRDMACEKTREEMDEWRARQAERAGR